MNGFGLFGGAHLIWLAVCAGYVIVWLIFQKLTAERLSAVFFRVSGVFALALHLAETAWRIYDGSFGYDTLPLHLCALASYLAALSVICPARFISAALFCPCLPGVISAVLFPDWTMYPPFSFISAIGFLSHAATAAHIAVIMASGRFTPSMKDLPKSIMFEAAYAAAVIPIDIALGVNYGFLLRPVPGSPLMPLWDVSGGGIGYTALFAAAVLMISAVWYGIWAAGRKMLRLNE